MNYFGSLLSTQGFNLKPALPSKRKAPSRYETGTGDSYCPCEVEDHFCQIYFEILDLAISFIQTRFDQPGFRTYQMTESLLMKAVHGERYSEDLASFYGDDFSPSTLQVQLQTLLKIKVLLHYLTL